MPQIARTMTAPMMKSTLRRSRCQALRHRLTPSSSSTLPASETWGPSTSVSVPVETEEAAREYLAEHGHWPDEAPDGPNRSA